MSNDEIERVSATPRLNWKPTAALAGAGTLLSVAMWPGVQVAEQWWDRTGHDRVVNFFALVKVAALGFVGVRPDNSDPDELWAEALADGEAIAGIAGDPGSAARERFIPATQLVTSGAALGVTGWVVAGLSAGQRERRKHPVTPTGWKIASLRGEPLSVGEDVARAACSIDPDGFFKVGWSPRRTAETQRADEAITEKVGQRNSLAPSRVTSSTKNVGEPGGGPGGLV
jgi:hypothetical protein